MPVASTIRCALEKSESRHVEHLPWLTPVIDASPGLFRRVVEDVRRNGSCRVLRCALSARYGGTTQVPVARRAVLAATIALRAYQDFRHIAAAMDSCAANRSIRSLPASLSHRDLPRRRRPPASSSPTKPRNSYNSDLCATIFSCTTFISPCAKLASIAPCT